MGLIASGSTTPNTSTLVGPTSPGGSVGPGNEIILAVVDCRNSNGIMQQSLVSQLMPLLTVSAVVQDPLLFFTFFNDISKLTYSTLVGGAPLPVSGITTFPTIGTLSYGLSTPTGPSVAQVAYRWPTGVNPMFGDVVPVLGPFCVVSVSGVGLFNVTVNQGLGSLNPVALSNSRDDYSNAVNKLRGVIGGENAFAVGAGITSQRLVPVLVSGEIFVSGSASVTGLTRLLVQAFVIMADVSATFATINLGSIDSNAIGVHNQTRFVVPPCYLQVNASNTTAGACNMSYTVTKGSY